jgi:hypothetical protein
MQDFDNLLSIAFTMTFMQGRASEAGIEVISSLD